MPIDRAKLVDLKERIAISDAFTPEERDFILDAINVAADDGKVQGVTGLLDPGNYLGRIDVLWAAFSIDEGGEGLCAAPIGRAGLMPLIAADRARLKTLIPIAKQIATMSNKPVRIAKFTMREDVEIFQP